MEELFEQLKRAVAPAQDSAAKRTATAMDGLSDRMADAAAASYIASVAEDAWFEESDHPREAKGGKGGGRFRTSGKTIEREDMLSGEESASKSLEEVKKAFKAAKTSAEMSDARSKRLEAIYGNGIKPTMKALKASISRSSDLEDCGYDTVENQWDYADCDEAEERGNFDYALAQDIYSFYARQNPKSRKTNTALFNKEQGRAWAKRNIWEAFQANQKGEKWEYEPPQFRAIED